MPLKRSRPQTENKFKNAVLSLLADSGCEKLGVNAIAKKACADKVLIYRYFGSLDGLLQTVAEQQTWLPKASELVASASDGCSSSESLGKLFTALVEHIRSTHSTHQIARWRTISSNPLTNGFNKEWENLWLELPKELSRNLDSRAKTDWKHACTLVALLVEAELDDKLIDTACMELLARDLPRLKIDA